MSDTRPYGYESALLSCSASGGYRAAGHTLNSVYSISCDTSGPSNSTLSLLAVGLLMSYTSVLPPSPVYQNRHGCDGHSPRSTVFP